MRVTICMLILALSISSCRQSNQESVNDENECSSIYRQISSIQRMDYRPIDTTMLMDWLHELDEVMYECYPEYNFLMTKLWILKRLEKYECAIDVLIQENTIPVTSPFGMNYEIMLLEYLLYKKGRDSLLGRQVALDLIDFMHYSFSSYQQINYDQSPDAILEQKVYEKLRKPSIPIVNPASYAAMVYYYPVRSLVDPKEKLLQEIEGINHVQDDIPIQVLRKELKYLISANKHE